MGDVRFEPSLERVRQGTDRGAAIRQLTDEGVVAALAASSRMADLSIENVLATEAQDRPGRYTGLVESLGELVHVIDSSGIVTLLDPAGAAILHVRAAQLVGRDAHSIIHPRCDMGARRPLSKAFPLRGRIRVGQPPFARGDGSVVRISYTDSPVLRHDEIIGRVVFFHDLTDEQRAAEAAAATSSAAERKFEAVVIEGADGRYHWWGPYAEHLFGYAADEVVGRAAELVVPHDRMTERVMVRERVARGGQVINLRTSRLRKDESSFAAMMSPVPVPDPAGAGIIGVVVRTYDLGHGARGRSS